MGTLNAWSREGRDNDWEAKQVRVAGGGGLACGRGREGVSMHDWREAWWPGVMLSIVLSLRAAGASISPRVSARPARRDGERIARVLMCRGLGRGFEYRSVGVALID